MTDELRGNGGKGGIQPNINREAATFKSLYNDRNVPSVGRPTLEHATRKPYPLRVRLIASHAGLTSKFVPAEVEAQHGWIYAASSTNILSVNLYYVRALAIKHCQIDGEQHSRINLNNSQGKQLLEISANPSLASRWQSLCQAVR